MRERSKVLRKRETPSRAVTEATPRAQPQKWRARMKLAKMPYISEILAPLVGCSPTRASALAANQETTRLAFPPPQCFRLLVMALGVWAVVWGTCLSAVAQEAPAGSDDVV